MNSNKGYYIDTINGKVETAEEHDKKVRADERARVVDEITNAIIEDIKDHFSPRAKALIMRIVKLAERIKEN